MREPESQARLLFFPRVVPLPLFFWAQAGWRSRPMLRHAVPARPFELVHCAPTHRRLALPSGRPHAGSPNRSAAAWRNRTSNSQRRVCRGLVCNCRWMDNQTRHAAASRSVCNGPTQGPALPSLFLFYPGPLLFHTPPVSAFVFLIHFSGDPLAVMDLHHHRHPRLSSHTTNQK